MEPDADGSLSCLHRDGSAACPQGARIVFGPFPDANYFALSSARFMLKLIVSDPDRITPHIRAEGVD